MVASLLVAGIFMLLEAAVVEDSSAILRQS